MMDSVLWGEIPGTSETCINLTPEEKQSLLKLSRPLPIDGPKFHSPITKQKEMKMEPHTDPLVINTIQLLEYKNILEKLLETVSNYKVAIANGSLEKMPSLQPAPEMPNIVEHHERIFDDSIEDDDNQDTSKRHVLPRVMQLSSDRVRQQLESSVVKLIAHAGYQTAKQSAVQLLADATGHYLKQFCSLLRLELDRRLEDAPDNFNGWSDALEAVCVEMGVNSKTVESHKFTVLALGEYYQDSVIRRHKNLVQEVQQMSQQYEAGTSSWGQDDIPEMHFPSSDEGAGGDNYNFDHATPTLDVGMQMLQSLEAGGDLVDTGPLSGDSYHVPDTLDTNMDNNSPSPGPAITKKRRIESGSKF